MSIVTKLGQELNSFDLEALPRETAEAAMDSLLIKEMSRAMDSEINAARGKGRGGWWDQRVCTRGELSEMIQVCVNNGDWVSVANYAAMLWARTQMDKADDK